MIEKELILRRVISDLKGFVNGEWRGTEGFESIIEALEKVVE
jgi:hypothetical protein